MRKSMGDAAAKAWGVPADAVINLPRLVISGDREIYIENHRGILGYTDTEIRISSAAGILRICGRGLVISRIQPENIFISGRFKSVEYEI